MDLDPDAVTLPEIVIAAYDPAWPARYREERARLLHLLGEAAGGVEHIGSTSVSGLAAKPIIDIMVGLRTLEAAEAWVAPLEAMGYVCCGDAGVPGRLFFRKGNPRSHHLNLVEYGGELWQRTLLFRDLLREDRELASEYAALKGDLAARHRTEPIDYGPAKAPFIEAVLGRHPDKLHRYAPQEIAIVDYDARWPPAYEEERARITGALADLMEDIAAIEHVGSTSVPGCAAKPVIDIMIGVRELSAGERCVEPLVALGYEYMGEHGIPGRFYFRKGVPRSHHIHLVEHGCDFWERHLLFRALLRRRPDLVEQYSALKRELAVQYRADSGGYTDAKTPFIEAALAQAPRP